MPRPAGGGGGHRETLGWGPGGLIFLGPLWWASWDGQVHLAPRERACPDRGKGSAHSDPGWPPQAPAATRAPPRSRQIKQLRPSCLSDGCPDSGARLAATAGEGRRGTGSQTAKLRPRTFPRSSCAPGPGSRKLFLPGRKRARLELGSGSGHGAPAHETPPRAP
uniref:Uncharacterized protein n=1 Tax=Sus scrofa TaxID=9823 RepID=A0A480JLS8_PIG